MDLILCKYKFEIKRSDTNIKNGKLDLYKVEEMVIDVQVTSRAASQSVEKDVHVLRRALLSIDMT